jgi:hypothetical protein
MGRLATALSAGSPKASEPVSAQSVSGASKSEILANLRQAALSENAADALCLVELRGFEPLTLACHGRHAW